jgi:NADPH2:quinone reductase
VKVRAIVAEGLGGTEVLHERDLDLPWPAGPWDVLVRMHAASVNPADIFFRQGGGYISGAGPMVLGHDGAGVVEAVGDECSTLRPGDRVCFCYGGIGEYGTYAEAAVVPEQLLARIPSKLSMVEAAAMPLVSITAVESLKHRVGLAVGQKVLVHAGAGGTGHIAIQIAKQLGASVATTVSTTEKQGLVRNLGADLAIPYREQDFVAAAIEWTGGTGLDAAFDNVGGETLRKTYRAMRPYGQVVTLTGIEPDDGTAYNANLSVHNEMMLTPMWLGLLDRLAGQAEMVREVMALINEGRVRILVAEALPLSRVAEAHALIERGGVTGKIVLSIADF